MARPSSSHRVCVLRKTKLGESDLILTMLSEDGSLLKAVAKGARKPTSPLSSRLELYSVADILVAEGRSLGIVQEARLLSGHAGIHGSIERTACAAPVAEILWRMAQEGLEAPRLFAFTCAAFDTLDSCEVAAALRVCAAALAKALAFCGFRPSFTQCVRCGSPLREDGAAGATVRFSHSDGGYVCGACGRGAETVAVPRAALQLAQLLLASTFDEVARMPEDQNGAFAVLQLEQQLVRVHVGSPLKSLSFLFACGLF